MSGRSLPPRRRLAVPVLAGCAVLAATCAGCRPGHATGHQRLTSAPSTSTLAQPSTATTTPDSPPQPTAAQRRAVRAWLHGEAGQRLTAIVAEQHQALAALARHDVYGAFAHCQTEQVDVERAEEGRGIPWRPLDADYQAGLARLAVATTRCLGAAGKGDNRDVAEARASGAMGERRLVATLAATRRTAH